MVSFLTALKIMFLNNYNIFNYKVLKALANVKNNVKDNAFNEKYVLKATVRTSEKRCPRKHTEKFCMKPSDLQNVQ